MDTTVIVEFLKGRLTTAAQMRGAAEEIGVSLATMYRFKKARLSRIFPNKTEAITAREVIL